MNLTETLNRWGQTTPLFIVGYFVALGFLRLNFSPFLEVDESQFVGNVDFRLIYDNSHPPLYNWFVRMALELTGWNWAESVTLVKFSMLAAYYILIWKVARRLVDERTGLIAVVAAAFLPQVVWMSTHTLAHSVMVMTGVAATTHALLRALQEPSPKAFIWLGLAAAFGTLAKYNFFLFAIPLAVVVATTPDMRNLLLRRDALLAVAVYLLLAGPTLFAAITELGATTERMTKLYRPDNDIAWFDLPYLGIDGLVTMVGAVLAWVGPVVVVWAIARAVDSRIGGVATTENIFANALGKVMIYALALFAVIVLLGDMHRVHERYLTPLLAVTPIYMAVAWPLSRSARVVAPLAAMLLGGVFIGYWAMINYGQHRYVYPYNYIASPMRRTAQEPMPIIAQRHDDKANLILALGWPGARTPRFQPLEDKALVVWRGDNETPPSNLIPPGFGPADKIYTVRAPLLNNSGERRYKFQMFERVGSPISAETSSATSPGSE